MGNVKRRLAALLAGVFVASGVAEAMTVSMPVFAATAAAESAEAGSTAAAQDAGTEDKAAEEHAAAGDAAAGEDAAAEINAMAEDAPTAGSRAAESVTGTAGTDAAGEGMDTTGGMAVTASGQLGDKMPGTGAADGMAAEVMDAADIVEAVYAGVTEEDLAGLVERAEEAFAESEVPGGVTDASEYERMLSFVREEVEAFVRDVLDSAKEEYAELGQEDVWQAVFLGLCERMMGDIEAVLGMSGAEVMSLLPLEEKEIYVDLKDLTPVELTIVPFSRIFEGEDMTGVDKIAYAYAYTDDYMIGNYSGNANLSFNTEYMYSVWMIPGGEQLDNRAIRYKVKILRKEGNKWLVPTIYTQNADGNRVLRGESYFYNYRDRYGEERYIDIDLTKTGEFAYDEEVYLKFDLNDYYGSSSNRAGIKIYEGNYSTAEEALAGSEITDRIYGDIDMTQEDAGYLVTLNQDQWITVVSFDKDNNVTGCLPMYINVRGYGEARFKFEIGERYRGDGFYGWGMLGLNKPEIEENADHLKIVEFELDEKYAVNKKYFVHVKYNDSIVAAYEGLYESIAAAENSGAVKLEPPDSEMSLGWGYEADYSDGVYFSFFTGKEGQKVSHFLVKAKNATPLTGSEVEFTGLLDNNGNQIECYLSKKEYDSYAGGGCITVIVEGDVDITRLAPEFRIPIYAGTTNLYAMGSSEPEQSGKSYHDFSHGAVQYTIVSYIGEPKNIWLTVKKANEDKPADTPYNLYINSLSDSEAETRVEGRVIYSKREIILGQKSDIHDILLMNMGANVIPKLSVELESDVMELDEYWTLNGNHDLEAFSGTEKDPQTSGELPNLAKVRLRKKAGVVSGTAVEGTLTVKADGKPIMVLELTGIAGSPVIITEDIPEAVKYVPYGTVIQNSSKYARAGVKYELTSGSLPDGMEFRESGEIYGIPKEEGSFTFGVKLISTKPSSTQTREFTLVVKENTDANVDAATDAGYDVTQRIPAVAIGSSGSHTFVSQGVLEEFVDVYLDGERLARDVDYDAESGSTRITISSQTLTRANEVGTHTLGVEFRTEGENLLRKAAQNFNVVEGTATDDKEPGDNGAGGNTPDNNVPGGDGPGNGNAGNNGSGNTGNSNTGNNGSGSGSSNDNGGSAGDGAEENNSNSAAGNPGWFTANTIAARGTSTGEAESRTMVYTVEPGDTLSKIAVRYYGNASLWRKIFEDNRDVIANPNRVRAGMRIRLYLADVTAEAGVPDATGTYTVRRGDSLWKIARAMYGQGWQWRRIYDANRSAIPETLMLRVGQILVIP